MQRTGFILFAMLCAGAFGSTNYTEHVRPLLEKHCTECHDNLGHDPDLSSYPFYTEKFSSQQAIVEKILDLTGTTQKMPPGNRPKLKQNEVATIQQWFADGLGQ